jgi:hypothetical protein
MRGPFRRRDCVILSREREDNAQETMLARRLGDVGKSGWGPFRFPRIIDSRPAVVHASSDLETNDSQDSCRCVSQETFVSCQVELTVKIDTESHYVGFCEG